MSENKRKENIKTKLNLIVDTIYNKSDNDDIGLLTGNTGIIIFWAYYSILNNDEKYLNKAIELISKSINSLNNGNNIPSFSAGISGFLWSLTHLVNNNFLDKEDTNDLLNELDGYIYKCMMTNVEAKKFDYLHESLGNGIYFLERIEDNPMAERYLEDLIDGLETHSHKETDGGLSWLSNINALKLPVFNLGLSHGIASIIAFLGKAYKKNVHKEKVRYLLDGSIKFLLKQMKDPLINGSYFPNWVDECKGIEKSRLGWCYGDLGIAMVLFQIGEILKDDSLKIKSIEIMTFNSNRRILEYEDVADAGLCHGTAGIAHIFNRMYLYTNIEKFKETSDFWFDETLKIGKFQDGLAGYKAWYTTEEGGWVNEFGILEGVAGIGLAMISSVSDIEPKWDECLLLS